MRDLSTEEMERFGQWLSIGLASRSGTRGRRQKNVMAGMWNAWAFSSQSGLKLRGTDFTFRVSLLIYGFHRAGMTIERAADLVGEYRFVREQLGKRKPSGTRQEEVGFGPTLREGYYYGFRRRYPQLEKVFELWWVLYASWKRWVFSADETAIRFVTGQYEATGKYDNAKEFLDLVDDIRMDALNEALETPEMEDRYRERRQVLERLLSKVVAFLDPREGGTSEPPLGLTDPQWQQMQETGMCARRSDIAMATVNLAILHQENSHWILAADHYRRALEHYDSSNAPKRLHDLVRSWTEAQIKNCNAHRPSNPRPVVQAGELPARSSMIRRSV